MKHWIAISFLLTGILVHAQNPYISPLVTGSVQSKPDKLEGEEGSGDWVQYKLTNDTSAKIFGDAAAQKALEANFLRALSRREAFNIRSASLIIPEIKFSNASFDSAVEHLRQEAERSAAGTTNVNIVMLPPTDALRSRPVTLDIRDIPFLQALRYVCDQVGADYSVETYAIVVTERGQPPTRHGTAFFPNAQQHVYDLLIPRIELRQAVLTDALEVLRNDVRKLSGGGAQVNFVVHTSNDTETRPITLSLGEVPFREALRYICEEAEVDFTVEPSAIVVAGKGMALPAGQPLASSLVIPEIKLRQATLSDALDFLKKRTGEISKGSATINFVLQMPSDAKSGIVTLDLANIPFLTALRYICYQAGAKFELQTHAILISCAGRPGQAGLKQ